MKMLINVVLICIVAAASAQQQQQLPLPVEQPQRPGPLNEGVNSPAKEGAEPQGQFPYLEVPSSQWPFYPVLPQFESTYNYDYGDITPSTLVDTDLGGQVDPLPPADITEPDSTENGCREEQYVCTRLYSINKPCKECLKSLCFYRSLRVYVINKEICVRTVCEQDEIQKAALCKDKFSRCGAMASSGLCGLMKTSCGRSCGDC